MHKKLLFPLILIMVVSLSVSLVGANQPRLWKEVYPNYLKPNPNGTCPINYHLVTVPFGIVSINLCAPVNPSVTPQNPPPTPPTPAPPEPPQSSTSVNPPSPPDFSRPSPPPVGSPPPLPNAGPQGLQPPREEKNKAVQEVPQGRRFRAVYPGNLYVRYNRQYTDTAYTYLYSWLPAYLYLGNSGNLVVKEYYYNSRRMQTRHFGWRPAGWNKFWFFGDSSGWHAVTCRVNGRWSNWIWVYVR